MAATGTPLCVGCFDLNGPGQPGLPPHCYGSYPNITLCKIGNYNIDVPDPCMPLDPVRPLRTQQVVIKDQLNFCMQMPDPASLFLQNNYYNAVPPRFPWIVQGEGFVQCVCYGSYIPQGCVAMAPNAIRAAHVKKNYTVAGSRYIQIDGTMDCDVLKINCTDTVPGSYENAGQFDDVPFRKCGKEPYSGVDMSPAGNPDHKHYIQQAGNGYFCMRICEEGTQVPGGVCDVTQDRAGCEVFMGVRLGIEGFTYLDVDTGVSNTATVSLPPLTQTTNVPGGLPTSKVGTTTSGSGHIKVSMFVIGVFAALFV